MTPSVPASSQRPKKASSSTKTRDPRMPKRAISSFAFFTQAIRPGIKQEHPEATFGEIGRMLGQRWAGLTDREKKPFLVLADQDKRRAERDLATYSANVESH